MSWKDHWNQSLSKGRSYGKPPRREQSGDHGGDSSHHSPRASLCLIPSTEVALEPSVTSGYRTVSKSDSSLLLRGSQSLPGEKAISLPR